MIFGAQTSLPTPTETTRKDIDTNWYEMERIFETKVYEKIYVMYEVCKSSVCSHRKENDLKIPKCK